MKFPTILPKEPYARTRRVYIVEALLEYLVALLVTGAFLSAICKQVGVSDAVTGIVSSFISLACVAQMFSGALITEQLFSIPGIGYTAYQSMIVGDIPFTMFYLSFMAILTLLGNLIMDVLYAVVDPRVRLS